MNSEDIQSLIYSVECNKNYVTHKESVAITKILHIVINIII